MNIIEVSLFVLGFFSPKTPRFFGVVGIVTSIAVYGGLLLFASDIAFLNRMAITLISTLSVGLIVTWVRPLAEPVTMPVNESIDMTSSPIAKKAGIVIIAMTIALYIYFW